MSLEIERKFLVSDPEAVKQQALGSVHIVQAYLSRRPESTVRVRIVDGREAYLTVKGRNWGAVRKEFEYEIPVEDALQMIALAEGVAVDKRRYIVSHEGLTWEVDFFASPSAGLIVAEVEIPSADTVVALPPWVSEEVTGNPAYYNSNLK